VPGGIVKEECIVSSLGKSMADINLGMLYLARELLQQDKTLGMAHLGITPDVATTLLELSAEELARLARTPMLLVGLRWRGATVWNCLRQYAMGSAAALPRAILLGEGELDHVH
jgi:hypothetical protein